MEKHNACIRRIYVPTGVDEDDIVVPQIVEFWVTGWGEDMVALCTCLDIAVYGSTHSGIDDDVVRDQLARLIQPHASGVI